MHIRPLTPADIPACAVRERSHVYSLYVDGRFVPAAPTQDGIVRYNPMRLVVGNQPLVDPA